MGDIAIQIRGVSYKPDDILSENDDNSIGILRANNIQEELDLSDIVYIRKDRVKDYQLLKKEDILICASSGSKNLVGKAVRIPYDLNLSFGAFCKVVRTKGTINSDYLSCFFQSDYYRNYISNIAEGANINNIKNEHIDNLLLNTPNESNQLFYSKILLSLFSIIKAKKKQIEKLDELIKSRFVEMFGDCKSNPYCFEKKKLKDTCVIITGNTPSRAKADYYGDYIEWIKSDNIMTDRLYPTQAREYLSVKGMNVGRFVDKDSILMSCIAGSLSSIGRVCITDRKVAFNQQINALSPKEYNVFFLYVMLLLSKDYLVEEINMALKGILSKSGLGDKEYILPPIDLQKQFADFVTQVEQQKAIVQQSIDKLETLKKSLMQEYFG